MRFTTPLLVVSLLVVGQSRTAKAADEKFVREAASGGMLEVKLGELAVTQGESADVKKFAKCMVEDHTRLNQELKTAAEKQGVAIPTELSKSDQAQYDSLKALKGADFDRAYVKRMLSDHKEDIAAFKKESADGQDEAVKAFTTKALPTLDEHLKMAREVGAKLGIGN